MICISMDKLLRAFAESALTTGELSDKANVSRTLISALLNGKKASVRPRSLGKLAKALNVKVEDLI